MYVTATEFKANFGKYMTLAEQEEIVVIRRGKPNIYVFQQKKSRAELVEALFNTLPKEAQNETRERIREGRLRERGYLD
jgi:prevent-host-death family protein